MDKRGSSEDFYYFFFFLFQQSCVDFEVKVTLRFANPQTKAHYLLLLLLSLYSIEVYLRKLRHSIGISLLTINVRICCCALRLVDLAIVLVLVKLHSLHIVSELAKAIVRLLVRQLRNIVLIILASHIYRNTLSKMVVIIIVFCAMQSI